MSTDKWSSDAKDAAAGDEKGYAGGLSADAKGSAGDGGYLEEKASRGYANDDKWVPTSPTDPPPVGESQWSSAGTGAAPPVWHTSSEEPAPGLGFAPAYDSGPALTPAQPPVLTPAPAPAAPAAAIPAEYEQGWTEPAPTAPSGVKSMTFGGPPGSAPLPTEAELKGMSNYEFMENNEREEIWDAPLSTNPEKLYQFLRKVAAVVPRYEVEVFGQHTEQRSRRDSDGNVHTETVHVSDFRFTIDLAPVFHHGTNQDNVHLFVKGATTAAHRGTMSKTFGNPLPPNAFEGAGTRWTEGRATTHAERKTEDHWRDYCRETGRPPWTDKWDGEPYFWKADSHERSHWAEMKEAMEADRARLDVERSAGTATARAPGEELMQWCEAYCADKGRLKSFKLVKRVWGWDEKKLRAAIIATCEATGYHSNVPIQVTFRQPDVRKFVVRSASRMVQLRHGSWFLIAVLCITLVYPVILIWQRLSSNSGGPYEVVIAAYSLKMYPPVHGTTPGETPEQARARSGLPAGWPVVAGPAGAHYLLGRREGEWFREAKDAIAGATSGRFFGELNIRKPVLHNGLVPAAAGLDGA